MSFLSERLRVKADVLRQGRWSVLNVDSLDIVELIIELEEAANSP